MQNVNNEVITTNQITIGCEAIYIIRFENLMLMIPDEELVMNGVDFVTLKALNFLKL